MNNQEIFDTIVDHLYKQQVASVDTFKHCQYRGENGTSCAVGCLIKDEFYDPMFEGDGAADSTVVTMLEQSLDQKLSNKTISLLEDLQTVHDRYLTFFSKYSRDLEEKLKEVAKDLDLVFKSRLND